MRGKLTWLLHFFTNMKLKNKMTLICTVSILLVSTAFLLASRVVIESYNQVVYEKTADSLKATAQRIELYLKDTTTLSTVILSDSDIQQNLDVLSRTTSGTDQAAAVRNLSDRLTNYLSYHKYIVSISLVLDDYTIPVGKNISPESEDVYRDVFQKTQERLGAEYWVSTGREDSSLICAREIRKIKDLSLRHLAYLVIRIDLKSIIEDTTGFVYQPDTIPPLLITSGDQAVFPTKSMDGPLFLIRESGIDDYGMIEIDRERYFVVQSRSQMEDWKYLVLLPYRSIFYSIVMFHLLLIGVVIIVSFLAIVLSRMCLNGVLNHFYRLVKKMDCFKKGKEPPADIQEKEERTDEIGMLNRNFDEMVKEVNRLIAENYVKQLLIKDAQIKMLEQQINPHFLYNVLNSIDWMAKLGNVSQISVMVESLGRLLRYTIHQESDTIRLSEELSIVKDYIDIQKIRFGERLVFLQKVEESYLSVLVPKMSVQPLIENAITHALEQNAEVCTIELNVEEKGEDLAIHVSNNGSQIEEDILNQPSRRESRGCGIGLKNINSRIKLIFGEAYGLSFENTEQGVTVTLTVPKKGEEIGTQEGEQIC